jgi:hypothetical protein
MPELRELHGTHRCVVWAECTGSVIVRAGATCVCSMWCIQMGGHWTGGENREDFCFWKSVAKRRHQYNIKTDLKILIPALFYKVNDSNDRFLLFNDPIPAIQVMLCRSEILCKSGGSLNLF